MSGEIPIVLDVDGFMVKASSSPVQVIEGVGPLLKWMMNKRDIRPITWTLSGGDRLSEAMNALRQAGYGEEVNWLGKNESHTSVDMMVKPHGYKLPSKVGSKIIVDDDNELAAQVCREGGLYIDPSREYGEPTMDWGIRMRTLLDLAIIQARIS